MCNSTTLVCLKNTEISDKSRPYLGLEQNREIAVVRPSEKSREKSDISLKVFLQGFLSRLNCKDFT